MCIYKIMPIIYLANICQRIIQHIGSNIETQVLYNIYIIRGFGVKFVLY